MSYTPPPLSILMHSHPVRVYGTGPNIWMPESVNSYLINTFLAGNNAQS